MPVPRPASDEFAPFYAGYIATIPDGADPVTVMHQQLDQLPVLFGALSPARASFRYAPDKWSVKEVVGHLSDAERVFSYRMMRVARGDETPLPGFDETAYVPAGAFETRPLGNLVAEWVAIRNATLALVHGMPADAWARRGTANGKPISARALLYITPGHVQHHLNVLRERYGVGTQERER
ncbi:MAG TPA: DinB family protein [Gemmatimonadales bacterium]|nr:DinB family protein [Gemmatimonadales bacterium]